MENYTKYKLKSSDELASVLEGKDNLFVIACNKCFKEFDTVDEPDCDEFLKIAAEQGKTVTGSAKVDFLCNKMHTERKLQDLIPEGTEHVAVISCGLGIQTVADLAGKPVIAASNTLNYRGHHGMALTKKSCDACAQCYLNITGGVCPIVDCSKSLVNGQCGGAKNGKCEVDPNKDCAWEKIYQRLAKQGRLEEFLNQPVQVRDFSKVNFKVINEYVKSIRDDRLNGYYGGVHPSEHKEFSEHIALKKFPEPKTLVISMSQHLGAPANPIVQVEMPGVVLDFPDDESAAIWYVTHSGQYNGQPVKKVYQNYSADPSIWTVVTANGETYEISLDADWNSFSNLAGPYPDENIQH